MTAKPDPPQTRLIYDALTDFGRTKRHLSPQMLEAYDDLLYCPAVQSRVIGTDPPLTERAVIAERLIRDAIASLPAGRDQQVANALLCAEPEYIGKNVSERRSIMETRFGFNWDNIYDEQRRPVLLQDPWPI